MKTVLPIEIFPIEDDGYHLRVRVTINGKPASLIVDTGASRTVFDEARITDFVGQELTLDEDRLSSGIGSNSMTSHKVLIEKIQLGKLIINNYDATVLDLMHVNQSYDKLELEAIDGILGSDILNDYHAVINYAEKELVLRT